MNLKLVFMCAVLFVEVKSECSDYLTCLSELIHGFFGTKPKNTTVENNFQQTNESDLYKVKDFSTKDVDRILTQVSSIVKDNVTGNINDSISKTAEFMNDKTKVLVKVFDFDKKIVESTTVKEDSVTTINTELTTVKEDSVSTTNTEEPEIFVTLPSSTENPKNFTSTENVKESTLTTNMIYEVNNMAVSIDNFEDNLILSESSYIDPEDNNTDYPNINYIEIYKDATLEDVVFVPTQAPFAKEVKVDKDIDNFIDYSANEAQSSIGGQSSGIPETVYPWIATIFVKNDSKDNQFEYYCDGALLNNRFILTAGRCVNINNATVHPDNLLIVLGKKSLHSVGDNEKVHKVKSIKIHENFTVEDGGAENDLAVLELDEPTTLNGVIQSAVITKEDFDVDNAATTAWGFTGDLTPVLFDKEASRKCNLQSGAETTFCATYGNNVALCPSYGGLHVAKHADTWYLRGIRTGDPERRGICINRDVVYTDIVKYCDWISDAVINKDL